jgi:hypothetical protein
MFGAKRRRVDAVLERLEAEKQARGMKAADALWKMWTAGELDGPEFECIRERVLVHMVGTWEYGYDVDAIAKSSTFVLRPLA